MPTAGRGSKVKSQVKRQDEPSQRSQPSQQMTSSNPTSSDSATEAGARADFFAALSHELRNPLSAIDTALAVIETGAVEPSTARALRVIRRQSHELATLAQQLTDLGLLAAGRLNIEPTIIDLADCIDEVADELTDQARPRQVTIEPRAAARPLLARADRGWLKRMVAAAVGEILRRAPPGSRIEIAATREDDGLGIRIGDQTMAERGQEQPLAVPSLPTVAPDRGKGRRLAINYSLLAALTRMHGGRLFIARDAAQSMHAISVWLPAPAQGGAEATTEAATQDATEAQAAGAR